MISSKNKNEIILNCRLPWDQRSLSGWIYETVFSVISSSLYLHINVVFLTFFIAICEFNQSFSEYFDALLKEIPKMESRKQLKKLLCDIIQYHVSIKRYKKIQKFYKNRFLFLQFLLKKFQIFPIFSLQIFC